MATNRVNATEPPIRCGPWTSATSRWHVGSSIWPTWWTGSAAESSPGGCRSPWRRGSAEALEEALAQNEKPEIFNTDQVSQFTSEAFTRQLKENEIAISMDGKGSWRDNVFVERIWRSIKYEEVYLHAYETVQQARTSIRRYLEFYNTARPHSSLKANTPDQVYFNRLPGVPLIA
jgi:integrase-like protein